MASTRRKDKSRVVLRVGELQRKDGTYQYSWIDKNKKRRYVYSKSLDDLREKEKQIAKEILEGNIEIKPTYNKGKKEEACKYCEYKSICCFNSNVNNYSFIDNKSKKELLDNLQ